MAVGVFITAEREWPQLTFDLPWILPASRQKPQEPPVLGCFAYLHAYLHHLAGWATLGT
jgi:hypothetical protein